MAEHTKWEYIGMAWPSIKVGESLSEFMGKMNDLGAEGWEAVGDVGYRREYDDRPGAYFQQRFLLMKRPKSV